MIYKCNGCNKNIETTFVAYKAHGVWERTYNNEVVGYHNDKSKVDICLECSNKLMVMTPSVQELYYNTINWNSYNYDNLPK